MKLRTQFPAVVFLLMLSGLASAARAQSFLISQNGKSVGSASLTLTRSAQGYAASSTGSIVMNGLNLSFTETASFSPNNHIRSVQLNGQVNGTPVTISTRPTGQQFLMNIFANGQRYNTPLAYHTQAVFFPDFDPAALTMMVRLGAAHNNANLWAIIPKQTGSIVPIRIATDPDMQGKLNNQTIAVHHFTINMNDSTIEVFSTPTNDIMQAEWTNEAFALVHEGFVLTPPAHPTVAPPKPPPTSQQNPQPGQQTNPQQNQPQ